QGPGCTQGWLRIAKHAWVCARHTRDSEQPATSELPRGMNDGAALPGMGDGAALPMPYLVTRDATAYESLDDARARANQTTIRGVGGFVKNRSRTIDGDRFYKTKRGWVPASQVEEVEPSGFRGVFLGPDAREK